MFLGVVDVVLLAPHVDRLDLLELKLEAARELGRVPIRCGVLALDTVSLLLKLLELEDLEKLVRTVFTEDLVDFALAAAPLTQGSVLLLDFLGTTPLLEVEAAAFPFPLFWPNFCVLAARALEPNFALVPTGLLVATGTDLTSTPGLL